MANEAVCIETPTRFARRTIADASSVPIGSIMALTDPNTVAVSNANDQVFGGIAWEEKTANDGIVEMTVALDGVWEVKLKDEAVGAGALLKISGANEVGLAANADAETGRIFAKAEEAGQNNRKRVRLFGY